MTNKVQPIKFNLLPILSVSKWQCKQVAAGTRVSISLRLRVYLSVSLNIVYFGIAYLLRPNIFLLAYTIST
jgi:hypothetical protein